MYMFVLIVFLFFMGAMFGWGLEVIYRHVADPEKRWFNPGFCVGPWLPIYGVGLMTVFGITFLESAIPIENIVLNKAVLFVIMSICMTIVELIAGIILLKYFNMRLWDYRNEVLNYKGFICIKFSIFWMILSAFYYFLIHPKVYDSVVWLSKNLVFSFVVGFAYGIFLIDIIYSSNVISKVRKYAIENDIIVKFEEIKEKIARERKMRDSKVAFFIFMLRENLSKFVQGKQV